MTGSMNSGIQIMPFTALFVHASKNFTKLLWGSDFPLPKEIVSRGETANSAPPPPEEYVCVYEREGRSRGLSPSLNLYCPSSPEKQIGKIGTFRVYHQPHSQMFVLPALSHRCLVCDIFAVPSASGERLHWSRCFDIFMPGMAMKATGSVGYRAASGHFLFIHHTEGMLHVIMPGCLMMPRPNVSVTLPMPGVI